MENQEKVTGAQAEAAELGLFNLYVSPLNREAQERRERLVRNRRQPDCRRRALFQELAIAVADEIELRAAVDERMGEEYADADNAQHEAQRKAEQAQQDAKNPLLAAFQETTGYKHSRFDSDTSAILSGDSRPRIVRKAVDWAIKEGILPQGTTALPDTETQYLELARWKPTE